jgi:hypothetical protein
VVAPLALSNSSEETDRARCPLVNLLPDSRLVESGDESVDVDWVGGTDLDCAVVVEEDDQEFVGLDMELLA